VTTPTRHSPTLRWLTAATLAFAPLAAPLAARAAGSPRTSSLGWVRLPGAEGCIGSRALALEVEHRLRREVFVSPGRAAVAVEGRVEPTAVPAHDGGSGPTPPAGFRAVITLSNDAGVVLGTRELRSAAPSCRAMDDDLALIIAVMIDPEAALALPAAPVPLPPALPPPRSVPEAVPAPSPPSWRVSLQAGGMAMVGLLPRTSAGVLLRSHVEPPHFWAFEVGGVLFPSVGAQQGAAAASFQLAEAFVSVCPLTLRAFGGALSACAGVQVGSLHAVGNGFESVDAQDQALFNVAVEGRARRRLVGPLVAGLGVGLVVPVVRARFSYDGALGTSEEIFQMAPVAGEIDLSLGVEFP
jgi:hypothetical protein